MDRVSELNKIHYEYFKRLIVDGRIKYSINLSGEIYENNEENLIQISRYLWYFSAVNIDSDPLLCDKIYENIIKYYHVTNGGFKWSETDEDYHLYSLSFALYGITEYYKLNNSEKVKEIIISLVNFIETNFYDKDNDIYYEQLDKQLCCIPENKIGIDRDTYTANSIIHLLEAYTNLCRVDESFIKLLTKVLNILINKFYSNNGYFYQYLEKNQLPVNSPISYGHDIETMWLIVEAITVSNLNLDSYQEILLSVCQNVDKVITDDGYLPTTSSSDNSTWWAIAEAVVGFAIADKYGIQKNNTYKLLKTYFIDNVFKNGYSINTFNQHGSIITGDNANCWKTPYHDGRMFLKLLEIEKVKSIKL
ncbi:AGE family epimerase/isomerase [Mollicutes bacterium LVI A0039]|nr:AGE family epimerase/isomerase [Mollicutes bacterium LVI A0039]